MGEPMIKRVPMSGPLSGKVAIVTGGNGGIGLGMARDSADNSAATVTLTATSLTGVFGAGGSLGFCDPQASVAFGYAINTMGPRWQNPRNRALIDALYGCL